MSASCLSPKRLARMRDVMASYVERGAVSGVVTLVSRHGVTHVDAMGATALNGSRSMQRDAILRISSITRPIAAVAAMILVEDCKLRLDDPVDRLLSELADRRLLPRIEAPLDDTPYNRPICLRPANLPHGRRPDVIRRCESDSESRQRS